MAGFGSAMNSGHFDANQVPSITGVMGTLGTADVSRTSATLPIAVDNNGAMYVNLLAGSVAASGTNVNVVTGTINAFPNSIISNLGTGADAGTLPVIASENWAWGNARGNWARQREIENASNTNGNGIQGVGLLAQVDDTSPTAITENQFGNVRMDTTRSLYSSSIPTTANLTFGTIGTTGATIFGTLVGGTSSGAGTEIFVTSVSLTIPSTAGSQDVSIGFGTGAGTFHSGTGRIIRGNFVPGGGIQKTFWPALNSGTNAQLTYFQAGAGTVEVDITYFTIASIL